MTPESGRLLEALYDSLPDPVFIASTDRIIIRVNAAAEKVFGYTQQEFVGMPALELYAAREEWVDVGRRIFPLEADAGMLKSQVRFRRKDGSVFESSLTLSRVSGEAGMTVGLIAIIHDLTDVLAAQTERLRTEKVLQEALSAISEGFVIFDAEDRLVQCNEAYRSIYALSAPAIVPGATFESILRYGVTHGQYALTTAGPDAEEVWIAERMAQHRDSKAKFTQKLGNNRWIQIEERITADNYRVGVRTDITSIVEVKAQTDALGRILEYARHEIFVFDPSTLRYSLVNRGGCANLQYDLNDLLKMTPLSIMVDVDAAAFEERLAPLIDGSRAFVEFRALHRRKDQSLYPCTVRLELLDLNSSRSYVAFVEDITEKVEIQTAAESVGRLINGVSQEIYVYDSKTLIFSLVNHGARRNLLYSTEELRGMTPLDIWPDTNREKLMELLAPLLDGRQPFIELRASHRRRNGTAYPCSIRIELLETATGSSFVAFVEDITQKVEIEAELEERRRNFETLVSNLPDAISRARPDMTLTYVNHVYADLVGMTPASMIGRKYVEFVPPERRQPALDNIGVLTPETPMRQFEQLMVDMDGNEHVILWSDLMIYDNNSPLEIVSVGRDITERHAGRARIAEQSRELASRNEALEQFTGMVSHDLKAPLRHVRQFADMIGEDAANGQLIELPLLTGKMRASVARMERMVGGLLEYSRFAYKVIHPVHFTISRAIAVARDNLTPVIEETGANIEVEAEGSMHGDFELIVELFQNLLANSLKYRHADQAPHIRISECMAGDRLEIRVEDNGIGIPADQAEAIFGVFHRLHPDDQTFAGAGIGLALCRKVVESHGGDIRLDTAYLGGARFVISLSVDARH